VLGPVSTGPFLVALCTYFPSHLLATRFAVPPTPGFDDFSLSTHASAPRFPLYDDPSDGVCCRLVFPLLAATETPLHQAWEKRETFPSPFPCRFFFAVVSSLISPLRGPRSQSSDGFATITSFAPRCPFGSDPVAFFGVRRHSFQVKNPRSFGLEAYGKLTPPA